MGNSFLESNTSQKKTRFQCTLQPTHHRKLCWCLGTKSMHLEWSYTNFQWCVSRTVHRNISAGTPKYIETFQLGPQSTSKHFSWDPKVHRNISAGPQSASKNFTWDLKVHRKNFNSPKVHPEFQCIPKSISNQPWKSPRNLEKNRKKQSRVENLWFSKCYFDLFCLYYFLLLLMYHFFGQFLGVKG